MGIRPVYRSCKMLSCSQKYWGGIAVLRMILRLLFSCRPPTPEEVALDALYEVLEGP